MWPEFKDKLDIQPGLIIYLQKRNDNQVIDHLFRAPLKVIWRNCKNDFEYLNFTTGIDNKKVAEITKMDAIFKKMRKKNEEFLKKGEEDIEQWYQRGWKTNVGGLP